MARSSWNFTLRKPKHRGVHTIVNLDDSIYSTLSKKPADLGTTDIDLCAIRIFLGDGSHRTIGCTPTTTCGELLDQLLSKIGLENQRQEHGLQIKYKYAEPRIAQDLEVVSEINAGVMDSIERMYLCKKTADSDLPVYRKKRLASYDGLEEDDHIYENRAVITSQIIAAEEEKPDMQPVLVNDKIANGFAKAWNRGSQLQECGSPGGQQPMSLGFAQLNTRPVSPQSNYSSYTMERKRSNLKRSTPVSPAAGRSLKIRNSSETDITKQRSVSPSPRPSPNHFLIPTSPDIGEDFKQRRLMQTNRCTSEEKLSSPCEHKRADNERKTMKKSQSVECLVSTSTNDRKMALTKSSSIQMLNLRDSGIDDNCSQCSAAEFIPASSPIMIPVAQLMRKKSLSHESLPSSGSLPIKASLVSRSVPSLATRSVRAETYSTTPTNYGMPNSSYSNLHAASLRSYKSMELLTGDDLEEIHTTLTNDISNQSEPQNPPVPKRTSSIIENCTISDEYLLNQGKRLSQVMNLSLLKKEQKGPIKSLFKKVGTLLKNKGKDPAPPTMPRKQFSSAQSRFRMDLPSPTASESLCAHWSDIQDYDRLNHYRLPSPLSFQQQPLSSSLPNPHQHISNEKQEEIEEVYDIAVPAAQVSNSPRENQEYLEIVSPAANEPSDEDNLYENHSIDQLEEDDFYMLPPQHGLNGPTKEENEDELDYENKMIESGANDSITFNGGQLHDYQFPSSLSQSAVPPMPKASLIYENNEIRKTSKNGIAFGKEELHVYQVPGSCKPVAPPLPPKPKPLEPTDDMPAPPLPPKPAENQDRNDVNSKVDSQHVNQPTSSNKKPVQSLPMVKSVKPEPDIMKQTDSNNHKRTTTIANSVSKLNTYPTVTQQRKRKPSTLSELYYEDISDWIPKADDNSANRSNKSKKVSSSKLVSSIVHQNDTLSVPQQLQFTISEPDLSRHSEIYDTVPDDTHSEEPDEYIHMKGGISVHDRVGQIKIQRSNSNVTEIGHVALLQQISTKKQTLGTQQRVAVGLKSQKKAPLPLPKPQKHNRLPSPANTPSAAVSPAQSNWSSTSSVSSPAPPPPPIATIPKSSSQEVKTSPGVYPSVSVSPVPPVPPFPPPPNANWTTKEPTHSTFLSLSPSPPNTFPSIATTPPPPPPPPVNITQQGPTLPPKSSSSPSPPAPPPPPPLSTLPNFKQQPDSTAPRMPLVPPQKPSRPQTLALPIPSPPPPPSPIYSVPNVEEKLNRVAPAPPPKPSPVQSFPTPPPPPPPISTMPRRTPVSGSTHSLSSPFSSSVPPPPPPVPAPSPTVALTPNALKSVVLKKRSPASTPSLSSPFPSNGPPVTTAPSPTVALTPDALKSVVLKKRSPVGEREVSKLNTASPQNQSSGMLFNEELFAKIKSISQRFDTGSVEQNIYENTT